MKDHQKLLFDKDSFPPTRPKEKRDVPKTSWRKDSHRIHPYMRPLDIAERVFAQNQGKVPQEELLAFTKKVRDAQDTSRESVVALLKESATDKSLSEILRHSIAGILEQDTRRENRGKKTPSIILVTRDNFAEAIAQAQAARKPR
ncbi:hypothetical protein KKF55_00805 [Patescibacteria group bacterium]|nr:hypothetical protein [Patescibacteria group bacterium]